MDYWTKIIWLESIEHNYIWGSSKSQPYKQCQVNSVGKAWECKHRGATVLASQVQSPLDLFCTSWRSNTKMPTLPTLCNYGKTQLHAGKSSRLGKHGFGSLAVAVPWGVPGIRAPSPSKFFLFHAVFSKIFENNRLVGNPGSATDWVDWTIKLGHLNSAQHGYWVPCFTPRVFKKILFTSEVVQEYQ